MTLELVLSIYLFISAVTLVVTFFGIITGLEIEEIDNFWDWVAYSLIWIKFPIKSILKLIFY